MVRRPLRPTFSHDDRMRLLIDMATVRNLAIMWGAAAGYGANQHRLAEDVQNAIDALATALTGDPSYYHDKPRVGGS